MATEQQTSDYEGIRGLREAISSQQYRKAMDVEYLLNYSSENDAMIESHIDEEIIQGIMDTPADDDYDPDDNCVFTKCLPRKDVSSNSNLK